MMQTTNLLSQLTGAGAVPARPNAAANQDAGLSFSQTFSQAAQRQAAPPAPAPAPAAPPKPASQQAPKQNAAPADKGPGARQNADASKPAQASTAKADKVEKTDSAKAADAERDAAAAAEAAASAPVVDMLALVASLNQVAQAAVPAGEPAVPAEEGASDAATGADPALAGLGAQLLPAEQPALEPDAEPLLAQPRQGARVELQADAGAGAQKPQLAAADELPADAAQPRFKLPDIQPPVQPQAAPAVASVQQSSMAQAVANAAGDKLTARVGTEDWDNQVGQKIVWMVAGKEQSASLTLNPPDLGPMQVVLNVTNDHADVTFSAAQPEVRQALEDAMPRLREMMSESGLSLGNASVNAGMPDQRQAQMDNGEGGRNGRGDGAGQGDGSAQGHGADQGSAAALEERAQARSARTGTIRSLVDTYI